MSYGRELLFPASPYGRSLLCGPMPAGGGRAGAASGLLLGPPPPPAAAPAPRGAPRSCYSSSYRRLPAPSSSLDHLEALLAGAAPSSARSSELKLARSSEKEQLQGLNDRFVAYIEKVRQLEQHNRLLEAEVAALRQRQAEPSRLQRLYEQQVRELRAQAETLRRDGARAALESQQLGRALQRLRDQAAHEAQRRAEAEQALRDARQDAQRDALARRDLEKQVEALRDEIAFLRRVHGEELAELQAELQGAQVSVEIDVSKPDLTEALKEIRTQYEVLSARNQQSAEEWYKSKFANFTEEAARSSDSIRQAKEEIFEYRRQLQARNLEVESLRSANESLERQLQVAEERSSEEIHRLQETISQLENALRTTKGQMARHLREYQDLLNVKMALDIEIAAYRKLLEGEETRLSTIGGSSSSSTVLSLSYPFSASPLSAFKGFSGTTIAIRREEKAEPQHGSSKDPRGSGESKAAGEEDSGDEAPATVLPQN
ncbi:low molecular weight neuronal intermediate filament-like [Elgaria multicarinata webbii]|uniref:low molecular weight neuronal intermediate filament-like n=1 Tax=Elgaria multicarinata webbii TaxID=159646 RepID=UPI002FCD1635